MATTFTYQHQIVEEAPEYPGAHTADGWSAGIAWRVLGWQMQADEDTEWSGYYQRTGRLLAIMVGDDRPFEFDPADLTPLPAGEYCPECGQVGCTALAGIES